MKKEDVREKKILSFFGREKSPEHAEIDEELPSTELEFQDKLKRLRSKYGDLLSENAAFQGEIDELKNLIENLLSSLILLTAQDEHLEIRKKLLELQESVRNGIHLDEIKRIISELKDLIFRIEPGVASSRGKSQDSDLQFVKKLFGRMEQSLQNILLLLTRDIAILVKVNDQKLSEKATNFVKLLEREFSAENVEKICCHFNVIYEEFRQTIREEQERLFDLLKSIFSNLIDTQEEFLKSLSENREWLERTSKDHDQNMIQKTKNIEKICSRSLSISDLKKSLLGQINEIKKLIRVKKEWDQKQLDNYISKESDLKRQLKEAKQQRKGYFEELLAVKEKVLEDPLTKVYNREAYRIKIQELLKSDKTFVLILLDIDNFKEVNDKLGHKVGDGVLQRLMYYVKKQVRSTDLLARYGGDEFVILMDKASLIDGERKAESILDSLSRIEFHLDEKSKNILKITMSIGVAERSLDDTSESLFERADKAMYLAKMSGKNKYRSERDLK